MSPMLASDAENMHAATPGSEKSVYYDAGNDSGLAQGQGQTGGNSNVARKPTITSGGIDQQHNANHDTTTGNVQGSSPIHDRRGTEKNVAFGSETRNRQQDAHDPSPAYIEDGRRRGHASGSGDTKSAMRDSKHEPGASQSPVQPAAATATATGMGAGADAGGVKRHATGAFAHGAAITGPDAIPDDNPAQDERSAAADSQLSDAAKKKISKGEGKDANRLIKVIKAEGKAQTSNLSVSLKELSRLQKVQKQSSKDETKSLKAVNKATANAYKLHNKFLSAKSAYEHAEADSRTKKDAMEAAKARAADTTKELSEVSRQAEELRRSKMVDDREREARVQELSDVAGKK